MLRTMTFLAGAGAGYVLGTRAGREHYEKIQGFAKETAERPEVRRAVHKAAPLAKKVTTIASQNLPGVGADEAADQPAGSSSSADTPDGPTGPASSTSSGESSNTGSNIPPRGTFSPTYGTF